MDANTPATTGKATLALFALIPTTVLLILALVWTVSSNGRREARLQGGFEVATISGRLERNRLYLAEYLLSGDTRCVDELKDGEQVLQLRLQGAIAGAKSQGERESLQEILRLENNWEEQFAKPLIEARKTVDRGDSTVALLQIAYLQHDPPSWSERFHTAVAHLELKVELENQ